MSGADDITIVIAGSFPINGALRDESVAAANEMRAATLQEDGCFEYRFSFATDSPDTMLLFEEWRDENALTAHFSAPHMAVFQGKMAGFVTGAPAVSKYAITSKGPLR